MNITRIAKGTTLGAAFVLASLHACQAPVIYKEIGKERVNPEVITKIDAMMENSKSIINNPNYECIGRDTVEITTEMYKNYDEYLAKLNKIAIDRSKNSTHNDIVTVLNSDKMYTDSGLDVYIPVEFYGKPNI